MAGPGPYGNKKWKAKADSLAKKRGGQWVCFEDGSCRRKGKAPSFPKPTPLPKPIRLT
jgi:hypothetical protein